MAWTPADPPGARPAVPGGGATGDFDRIFAGADRIAGWLTREQARLLYDCAAALPPGSRIVEIGSHQGRSTVVLAAAHADVEVVSIDPFVGAYGGAATAVIFEDNLARAEVTDRVRSLRTPSESLRPTWTGQVDLLYVDGAHDPVHAFDDLQWSRRMPQGATVLLHDAFSSVGVTLAICAMVLRRLPLRYLRREGSLAVFVVGPAGASDVAHMLTELPWFVRNVVVKVVLRLRLHAVARLLGHEGTDDPY